jgi:hypothetical protein
MTGTVDSSAGAAAIKAGTAASLNRRNWFRLGLGGPYAIRASDGQLNPYPAALK